MSNRQQVFVVNVRKLVKVVKGERETKVENDFVPEYIAKPVPAESAQQAYELVLAELIKAEAYDPADPLVEIEVCAPFAPVSAARY